MSILEIYGADVAWIHDQSFGDLSRSAADLVIGKLGEPATCGGPIVDLGCGSGIFAYRLLAAGFDVQGIDISPFMIELASRRAPAATYQCCAIDDAVIADGAAAVCAINEVLNYDVDPNNAGNLKHTAARVYDALKPGGIFVFDLAAPGRHGKEAVHRSFHDHDDWAMLIDTTTDDQLRKLLRHISVFRRLEGNIYRRSDEEHVLTLYSAAEVVQILSATGFSVVDIHGYEPGSLASPERGWSAYIATKSA